MLKNGVCTYTFKLIILFGLELSHGLAKFSSLPFFVELMRLFGNACLAKF